LRVSTLVTVVVCALATASLDLRAQGAAPAPPASPTAADSAAAPAGASGLDVEKLFANTCGWCHSNAGRTAGRGPQLMGTSLTDAEIIRRIKNGKPGAMPSFAAQFNDDELQAIVRYIRGLKDDGAK
jgi:mono/diheme cytochrome c family protein